jgi:hypothetical protein
MDAPYPRTLRTDDENQVLKVLTYSMLERNCLLSQYPELGCIEPILFPIRITDIFGLDEKNNIYFKKNPYLYAGMKNGTLIDDMYVYENDLSSVCLQCSIMKTMKQAGNNARLFYQNWFYEVRRLKYVTQLQYGQNQRHLIQLEKRLPETEKQKISYINNEKENKFCIPNPTRASCFNAITKPRGPSRLRPTNKTIKPIVITRKGAIKANVNKKNKKMKNKLLVKWQIEEWQRKLADIKKIE